MVTVTCPPPSLVSVPLDTTKVVTPLALGEPSASLTVIPPPVPIKSAMSTKAVPLADRSFPVVVILLPDNPLLPLRAENNTIGLPKAPLRPLMDKVVLDAMI